jgi:hypothetical protein
VSRFLLCAVLALVALHLPARAQESDAAKAAGIVGEIETGNGCAVEDAGLFEKRRAEGPETTSHLVIDDLAVTLYPRRADAELADGELPMEYIVIERGGACQHVIADANAFIMWARPSAPEGYSAADPAPLAIFSSYSGGAHCCTTLHVLFPGKELKLQELTLGNAEASITQDWAGGAPRLSFGDDSFAYWNVSFAGSPAGSVMLDWSAEGYRLSDSMRSDAPDADGLKALREEISTGLVAFGGPYTPMAASETAPATKGELDPAIWSGLLDLIYSGHADIAAQTFDAAWPAEVKGKRAFWRDFVKQMESTWIWAPWNLKDQLDPEMAFAHGE